MPIQPTRRRTQSPRTGRTQHLARRVKFPTVGQCFDITVTRDTDGGWMIWIPEISGFTRARRRVAVEFAARKCIAARTGIPFGYVAVFVTSETG